MGLPFKSRGEATAASLSPGQIANLAAWYDVSSGAGTTSNLLRIDASNRVSLIADRSGNSPVNVLCLNGVAGNSASLADSVPLSITGDIDIQARLAMDDWTPSAIQDVVGKWNTTTPQRSYLLQVNTTGTLIWNWSTTGSDTPFFISSVAPTVSDLAGLWVRVTMDVDNGSGQHEVRFWTGGNSDTPNWVQLGVTRTGAGTTSIFNSTATLYIGAREAGSSGNIAARIFRTRIYADLTQTDLRLDANFATFTKLASSGTESSSNAATVTINSSGDLGARVAGERDLVQLTASKQPIYLPWSGTNYAYLHTTSDFFTTPDSAAFPTGDIDIRWHGILADYTPSSDVALATKNAVAGQRSWRFLNLTSGRLYFGWYADGTTELTCTTTNSVGTADGTAIWYRVTLDVDNGAGGRVIRFLSSTDGATWTLIEQITQAGTTSIFDGTGVMAGTAGSTVRVFRTTVSAAIDGAPVIDFDASRYTSGTNFTASTGEVWTLTGGATIVTNTSLYFDGTDDYMKAAAFSLSQPETVYFVGSQVSWVDGDTLLDGNSSASMQLFQNGSSPNFRIWAGASFTNNGGWAIGVRALLSLVFNGASSATRVNRTTAVTGNASTGAGNGFALGATGAGTAAGNQTTNEVAIYAAAHDTATVDRWALYAASKWRISGV